MKLSILTTGVALTLALATGCSTTQKYAGGGAAAGAAAGAVIGNNSGAGSWAGAAIGGVIGGLGGAALGQHQENKELKDQQGSGQKSPDQNATYYEEK